MSQVYTTVGSEEKVQYLMDNFSIPRNRIFKSRDDSFLGDVMRETEGLGVDIVLNSLSGGLLHASWKCVAEFGKLVELGKRDLVGFGRLDLEPFLANRSYCCLDLAHAMSKRPESVGRLVSGRIQRLNGVLSNVNSVMRRWIEMYSQGRIGPIRSMTVFDAREIEQSFRYLQNGDHIGKAVVRIPEDASKISSTPHAKPFALDSEASYLLTGGLGGLGRSVASWLVERGARNIIFLSRSAGKSDGDKSFLAELNSMGCSISAIPGRADDMETVQLAFEKSATPIKGVIHLAMVLRVSRMTLQALG